MCPSFSECRGLRAGKRLSCLYDARSHSRLLRPKQRVACVSRAIIANRITDTDKIIFPFWVDAAKEPSPHQQLASCPTRVCKGDATEARTQVYGITCLMPRRCSDTVSLSYVSQASHVQYCPHVLAEDTNSEMGDMEEWGRARERPGPSLAAELRSWHKHKTKAVERM